MRKIYIKELERKDMRLGRQVYHDSMSLSFGFDTTGLQIVDVVHERYIPILNQGNIGSCTGNAGIGSISSAPFENKDNPVYTRDENGALKLYSAAETIDGVGAYPPVDRGSSGLSIAKALYNVGLISAYQHTFTLNDALKALTVYPIISGMNWYSQMFTPDADGRVHPVGTVEGGHEVQAYKIDTLNGRIWFHNSWGSDWGVNGDFYLTWADFAYLLSQQGDVTVLIPVQVAPPAPASVKPVLKLGDKGPDVITLQNNLNKNGAILTPDGSFGPKTKSALIAFQLKYNLGADGICGKRTWQAFDMIEIITSVAIANGIEPLLMLSVATCESGLNPLSTLYNPPSKSTDRGLFQWNNVYHKEITDAQAFDPKIATQFACNAVKSGHLHAYWSASQPCWKKKLTPELLAKYKIT